MSKHTPGPWEFVVEEAQKYFDDNYGPYGMERYGIKIGDRVVFIYGQCFPWSREDTEPLEWQANAHLIAAAPKMLKELERICNECTASGHELEMACRCKDCPIGNAIAKAKGER